MGHGSDIQAPKTPRREVNSRENSQVTDRRPKKDRILYALLDLGHIIGLDLPIDEMLEQIGRKAVEVIDADRYSIFLYNPGSDELYTTVALGMDKEVIRIPADTGIAGYCFRSGEVVNLKDAHLDPRFNKNVDLKTGYRTRTLLTMPFYGRSVRPVGVAQILNKRKGLFTKEDEDFLQTFSNHAAIFIERVQLQKARLDAVEQSRQELERLNRCKSKALNHLSHEVRTPLAIIQGNVRTLKRKLSSHEEDAFWQPHIESLERNLGRLTDIQRDVDKIFKTSQEMEAGVLLGELELLWKRMENLSEMPDDIRSLWDGVKLWMTHHLPDNSAPVTSIDLHPFVGRLVRKARHYASHRDLDFQVEGRKDLCIKTNLMVLREVLEGLLKNAAENTPDGSMIRVVLEQRDDNYCVCIEDFGTGITEENLCYIFGGLFHTKDTDLYTSKKPYDFGAGGKGLDLLRAKTYGEHFGFTLSVKSRRCAYIPTDHDVCPGMISNCPCVTVDACIASGGTAMSLIFPVPENR